MKLLIFNLQWGFPFWWSLWWSIKLIRKTPDRVAEYHRARAALAASCEGGGT